MLQKHDYTAYYTEFINRFNLKWVPCYIIVLSHLFEHELNNVKNDKYKLVVVQQDSTSKIMTQC